MLAFFQLLHSVSAETFMFPRSTLSLMLAALLIPQPFVLSAQSYRREPYIDYSKAPQGFPNIINLFKVPNIPEIDLANSARLDQLIYDGKLYLSLQDAIALAIENNLDIEFARYGPKLADTDILRAKSGQQLRGTQTQISTLSTGQTLGGGGGGGGAQATGITGQAGGGGGGGAGGVGDAASFFGTQAVNLDPRAFANINWGHFSQPQTSDFVTGTNTFIREQTNSVFGIRQGFLTGTQATLSWGNTRSDTNSLRNNFNPSLTSRITVGIDQPLLQGFGVAVNKRQIIRARNLRDSSNLLFKEQVITVIVLVQRLYWDLVSQQANLEAAQEALRLAEKLYEDNKRRVEIGTLAPIEIVRAEAEVAARQEVLTVAETQIQIQETLIKNALSKNGLASPSISMVRIIPTDRIEVPASESMPELAVLTNMALAARPDIGRDRIALKNTDINLRGIKNGLKPSLDLSIDFTNNGLAGQINPDLVTNAGQSGVVSPFFLGGLGTSLGQVFRRNFPDYSVALQLNIPLRNRQAQADMTASLLEKRQQQIRMRQSENSIRLQVQQSIIQVQQARARFSSAVRARELQEQTLSAEQKKFDLGASTIFLVVTAQRDLVTSRSQEITAQNNYIISRVALDQVTGHTLTANDITIADAFDGVVDRHPDAIPAMSSDQ